DNLALDDEIGAICVSRPANPTGNVLTDSELARLASLAKAARVPLIIDGAYGLPFPGIVFGDATPLWNEDVVLCLSLSKLGLPGVRTGIVVAHPELIDALTRMTAVLNLAVGSVGPVLAEPWVESGEILALGRRTIMPFYRDKACRAREILERELEGVPFRIHELEGAFFMWLWLPGLPIASAELYRRLKERGVLVLSGHYFFPGLDEPWPHKHECVRISYAQDDETVARGLALLAREVRAAFDGPPVHSVRASGGERSPNAKSPSAPERQAATAVLMIRPAHFGANAETAASNRFQSPDGNATDAASIAYAAPAEFDALADALERAGGRVHVLEGRETPVCPDEGFPNNWFSTHADGTRVLDPMMATNRRLERRSDLRHELERHGYAVRQVLDLSGLEARGLFLEGTGSLVLDRANRLAFACVSARTSPEAVHELCARLGYEPIVFGACDRDGHPIYHTNVMMSVGTEFAVVASETIRERRDRERVLGALRETGKR